MAPAHMLIHMNTHNAHLHRLISITTVLAVEVHNLHASSLTRVTRKLNGESRGQVRRCMKLCCHCVAWGKDIVRFRVTEAGSSAVVACPSGQR